MKTFFKKNLIGVFALVLGIGTMSFKMVSSQTVYWYKVEGTQITDELAENQTCEGPGDVCAIGFTRNSDIPTEYADGLLDDDFHSTVSGTLQQNDN